LTDDDWLYGGSPEKITETLINGRRGMMPAQLNASGDKGIEELVAYVLSLSNRADLDQTLVDAGKARSITCKACHGQDGKGNQMIGAPNLTDQVWLYGGTNKALTETLKYGRNGVMPAFNVTLGKKKIHLVTAYVYSLSQDMQ
jgi:cytochrome c oxidase cbb3-type subunit 3